MRKVYISSTFKDLQEYREAVATALRKIRYDVVRMEEYVARDARTRAACEADVAASDIYVGIFAWRYGYVPGDDNDGGLSITELEYRKATGDKICLVFLLSDEAPWRYQQEATQRIEQLNVLDEITNSFDLGPSYLPNIQAKIVEARDADIVEIRLGPTPWWTTRLHFAAALATDYTSIRQFLFLESDGCYVTMTAPMEIRRALARRYPHFEVAYLNSRLAAQEPGPDQLPEIDRIAMSYPGQLAIAVGEVGEQGVKQEISSVMLRRDLGIESSAEGIEEHQSPPALRQWEFLRSDKPFVVLLNQAKVVSVVDRVAMASKIARGAVAANVG